MVDFWGPWYGRCFVVAPIIEKLSKEYNGKFKFCKLNLDENPQTVIRYQVMSIPLMLFFKNGQLIDSSLGAVPESAIRPKVETLL